MPAGIRGASSVGDQKISSHVLAIFQLHAHGFFSSLGRLIRTPFSTMMAVIVIAIALSLSAVFYVLVDNVQTVSGRFIVSNQISLFLKFNIDDQKALAVAESVRDYPEIDSVTLISKRSSLEEFKRYSGFSNALDVLDYNPLPVVIQVKPKEAIVDPSTLQRLTEKLETLRSVDFAQFDLQWIRRLESMMEIAKRGVVILAVLLSMAVMFVVSNTIRLELRSRYDEIIVMKLLGATNRFIRRPFIYSGFWYGFLGGILACLVVLVALLVFEEPVNRLSLLYDADYQLVFLGPARTFLLLIFSSVLGIAGAWLVLVQHLYKMNPE